MKIGIDIDDTITDTWECLIPHYSKTFNVPVDKLKKSIPYYPAVEDKVTLEEYFEKVIPIYDKYIRNVPLKENVKEVIDKLYELGHSVVFITDRGKEQHNAYENTKGYLDKHQIKYDKLFIKAGDKAKICCEENIDLFIDNSIKHCNFVSECKIEILMFETIYNKDIKEFKHVKNWNEIYEYIKNRGWH